jgi:RNA-directed DNA polymerase
MDATMTEPTEHQPARVPETANPAGAIWTRWDWVAPTVWTERMLTTLEEGIRGGCWYSLIDKISSERHLHYSAQRVLGNGGAPGVDHVTTEQFDERLMDEVRKLSQQLLTDQYCPQAVRRVQIPKPGSQETRPLGIPTVRDRVVQAAVRHALEPIFEREFAEHSYGFRPHRGCKDALRRVDSLLKAGYRYVVDVDLKSYFDTIPHERLLQLVAEKVTDGRVLALIRSFLKAGIFENLQEWTPEKGAPQGAVISPLLSNIYLNPLDHLLARQGFEMVRYADDFVILCRTPAEAERALKLVQEWTAEAELTLHPQKTRIVNVDETGFDFLGYHFYRHYRFVRKKSRQKLKETIRSKTRRNNGRSLAMIIQDLNTTLRGWFGYFKHCHHRVFSDIDSYVRGRLRSILRRRRKRRGRARGSDHQRWPNRYFAEQGLLNLKAAHALACQSPRG